MANTLADLWEAYRSTLGFAIVNALFGLSTYAVLSVGILSFATVTYAAAGGFIGTQLALQLHWPTLLVLPAAAVAGAALAWLAALILLRLDSHWMALASLALVLLTRVVAINATGLTGGVSGLSVPLFVPFVVMPALLLIAVLLFWRLGASWYGIAARAVREDAVVAATIGIPARRIRMLAFVISGATGGAGGMALALMLHFLSPDTYFINVAFTMIAAVVLGGSYHWAGAIIGALVFTVLPVLAQAVLPAFEQVLNGVALLLIMIFLPRGLIDPRQWRLRRVRAR